MSRPPEDATAGAWVLLTGLAGAAFALVLPPLLAAGVEGPATVTLAVLALALAAIARHGSGFGALTARTVATARFTGHQPPPMLTGRVTDHVHHPLRPRAPGLA